MPPKKKSSTPSTTSGLNPEGEGFSSQFCDAFGHRYYARQNDEGNIVYRKYKYNSKDYTLTNLVNERTVTQVDWGTLCNNTYGSADAQQLTQDFNNKTKRK
jgi:hypothetical protein